MQQKSTCPLNPEFEHDWQDFPAEVSRVRREFDELESL
jgi:hypothetical protein